MKKMKVRKVYFKKFQGLSILKRIFSLRHLHKKFYFASLYHPYRKESKPTAFFHTADFLCKNANTKYLSEIHRSTGYLSLSSQLKQQKK